MRTLIALSLIALGALSSPGQGLVTFQNSVLFQTPDPTGGNRLVYDVGSPLDPVRGTGLTGSQYVAELYAGEDAASLRPVTASLSRFRDTPTANPGRWLTFGIYGENEQVVLADFDEGSTPTLQIRVWDLSLFPTYEAAVGNGISGASAPFAYTVHFSGLHRYMEGMQAFAVVPEPGVLLLGLTFGIAVGVVAVGGQGRRKKK